jgi:type II secretory pathway component PulM
MPSLSAPAHRRAVVALAAVGVLLLLVGVSYLLLRPLYDLRDEMEAQRAVSEQMLELMEAQETLIREQDEDSSELLELQRELVGTTIPLQQRLVDESIPLQRQLVEESIPLQRRLVELTEQMSDDVEEMNERTAPPGPSDQVLQE